MKIMEKLFQTVICLVMVLFAIFGNILFIASFQNSLQQETERGLEEIKMLQYALSASLNGLPEQYKAVDTAVGEIAVTIKSSMQTADTDFMIFNEDREKIYETKNHLQWSLLQNLEEADFSENFKQVYGYELNNGNGIWQISKRDNEHYMEAVVAVKSPQNVYYLEMQRNIEAIYKNRGDLMRQYFWILLLTLAAGAIVAFWIAFQFTRPIHHLSKVTKDFAGGNYASRVEVSGNDEMTQLMSDFNTMASQLEQNIWQLEDAARRQEEFTGAFAHELKTPLTSVIGYSEMLRSLKLSEEEQILSADTIYQQGKRLERLSQKMLELVSIGKQKIDFKEIEAAELFEEVELFVRTLLKQKEIGLHVSVEDGTIWGDGDLLCSLFGNLIENAAKASKKGSVIELTGQNGDEGYIVRVQDHGCGMKAEEIDKITEAFYRIDKSRARKEGGTGLGMALCDRIVFLHGAAWKIESAEREGTRVTVRFEKRGTAGTQELSSGLQRGGR
ncbi:MAG: HAMP domain-containing protein [Eubacterium sp.]|jgi:Signal transduction histidine kinase|nr:HAMP domain-containing protein [Eubacterium sp.]